MTDTILLDRLLTNANIRLSEPFVWDSNCITIKDVKDFISAGNTGTDIPYGDAYKHPADNKDKDYHISRVAYFVQHPDEICDIDIDNLCVHNHITSTAIITDGWHRLMAACILGIKTINVNYGGRTDVLEYLQGLRDKYDLIN